MKNPELLQFIEEIIRQLHKTGSKVYSGQDVPAYGDIDGIISFLMRKRKIVVASLIEEADVIDQQIFLIDDLIRQIRKAGSKIYSGQDVPAYRDINRILADLERRKKDMLEQAKQSVEPKENEK